jgi:chorismate binding enzyme
MGAIRRPARWDRDSLPLLTPALVAERVEDVTACCRRSSVPPRPASGPSATSHMRRRAVSIRRSPSTHHQQTPCHWCGLVSVTNRWTPDLSTHPVLRRLHERCPASEQTVRHTWVATGPSTARAGTRPGSRMSTTGCQSRPGADRGGETYQCNLTVRMHGRVTGDPLELYRDLALNQRGEYNAYLDLGRFAIASASPELFFRRASVRTSCCGR